MQLTVAVVILTAVMNLVIDGRSRALAASFFVVVAAHFVIHVGPRWLVFSVIARSLGTALKHLSYDPTSSVLAMLAAGLVGWLLAGVVRAAFSDEPRGDWDPDRPKSARRSRKPA
jgi:hypothetical protein